MTIQEAIVDIRDNIKPIVGGISLDMAIKSLEAWEKIKEEIKDLDLGFVDEEYQAGVAYGIMKITKIIDKHLSEVS